MLTDCESNQNRAEELQTVQYARFLERLRKMKIEQKILKTALKFFNATNGVEGFNFSESLISVETTEYSSDLFLEFRDLNYPSVTVEVEFCEDGWIILRCLDCDECYMQSYFESVLSMTATFLNEMK